MPNAVFGMNSETPKKYL